MVRYIYGSLNNGDPHNKTCNNHNNFGGSLGAYFQFPCTRKIGKYLMVFLFIQSDTRKHTFNSPDILCN
jgi:hypothetical protein